MGGSKEAALAGIDLFAGLNTRQMAQLAQSADVVSVHAGKVLIREGGLGRELLVIISGAAEVRRNDQTIATMGPGDSIGEMSLLDGKPTSATVVVTEPSELVVIEGRRFGPLLSELPGLAESLLATLAARLRETDKAFDL